MPQDRLFGAQAYLRHRRSLVFFFKFGAVFVLHETPSAENEFSGMMPILRSLSWLIAHSKCAERRAPCPFPLEREAKSQSDSETMIHLSRGISGAY